MIVLDTSAAVDALIANQPASGWVVERVAEAREIAAPHLIDVEVASALRRLVRQHVVPERRANDALEILAGLDLQRYPHVDLLPRIWELRQTLTAYDGVFVALAEALDATLVTTDAALGRAAGPRCRIRTYSR